MQLLAHVQYLYMFFLAILNCGMQYQEIEKGRKAAASTAEPSIMGGANKRRAPQMHMMLDISRAKTQLAPAQAIMIVILYGSPVFSVRRDAIHL